MRRLYGQKPAVQSFSPQLAQFLLLASAESDM